MEANTFVLRRREASDAGTVGAPELRGPGRPPAGEALRERAEHCELTKGVAAACDVRVEGAIVAERRPEQLEGGQLERVDGIAVDDAVVVQRAAGLGGQGQRLVVGVETRDVFDAQ